MDQPAFPAIRNRDSMDLDDPTKKTILDYIDWNKYQILPNTAGCATVEEALFIARLGREVGRTDFVKLEVIPDAKYLFPDGAATLEAARQLEIRRASCRERV